MDEFLKQQMAGSAANGTIKHAVKPVDPADVAKKGMAAYRAPHLLQPHRAREALADAHAGKIPPLIGFFCGLSCPPVAKVVSQLGFDIVWIDWEHAATNVETMTQMVHDVQFISEGRSMAFVRVPGHDHASIGNALDAGASIIVPQADTVEQAKHICSAAKYGSVNNGTGSAPPCRFMPGYSDIPLNPSLTIQQNVNKQAAIIIQIETLLGIENLDAILTECGEHIDSVWLGSLDARVSMGLPGFWGSEPEWVEAVAKYEATLAKHDKPASELATGPPEMKAEMARARSCLFSGGDLFALLGQAGELAYMRENFPIKAYKGVYKEL